VARRGPSRPAPTTCPASTAGGHRAGVCHGDREETVTFREQRQQGGGGPSQTRAGGAQAKGNEGAAREARQQVVVEGGGAVNRTEIWPRRGARRGC